MASPVSPSPFPLVTLYNTFESMFLTLAIIVLNTSRFVSHRISVGGLKHLVPLEWLCADVDMVNCGADRGACAFTPWFARKCIIKHRNQCQRASQLQSVETFPAPLLCPLRLLVMFLPRYLHLLHPNDLIRIQRPSVVADPKLMWKHLHPRKR